MCAFNSKKYLGMSILLSLSAFAEASQEPAFSITEVDSSASGNYGPFAVSMSDGDTPSTASVSYQNNMFSYMMIAPHEYDLGQHMLRMYDCYTIMDSSVCNGYWDGDSHYASTWRYDMLYYKPEVSSTVNGNTTDENTFVMLKAADNGDGVGYRVNQNEYYSAKNYYRREGYAVFDGKKYILQNPLAWGDNAEAYKDIGGYATALSYKKLSDGRILVGGYSSFGPLNGDLYDYINSCYLGDHDANSDLNACPGFRTQATIWIIDPNTMTDGTTIIGTQAASYLDSSNNMDGLPQSAVTSFVEINNQLYALGYSATDDYNSGGAFISEVATYWPITVDTTVSFGQIKEINGMERPGNGDDTNIYTWIQAGNKQGTLLTNRKMDKSENSNRAMMFGFSTLSSDGTTSVLFPFHNVPINGANSQGADINDHNVIVGWRDNRNDKKPVNYGVDRAQEGFIYTVSDKGSYYLNDLICGLDDQSNATCTQNGVYYYIEWPVAINNNNIIYATAFRYNSYEDWQNYRNATTVTVKLTPNSDLFSTDSKTESSTINTKYVVNYPNKLATYSESSSGSGGAITPFWLLILAVSSFCLGRKRK